METCMQCGATAESHPIVGVMKRNDQAAAIAISEQPGGAYVAVPVCTACHQAPTIKAHFFMRNDSAIALRLAGMSSLTMPGKR